MMLAVNDGDIVIFKAWPEFNLTQKNMMNNPELESYELAKTAIDSPLACSTLLVF